MNTGGRVGRMGAQSRSSTRDRLVAERIGAGASKPCVSDKQEGTTSALLLPEGDKSGTDQKLVGALIADLTALLGLHLQYKVYEWTVEGLSWYVHRSLFVDLGHAVAKSIDMVADRIVGLGGTPVPDVACRAFQNQWGTGSVIPKVPREMIEASLRTERKIVDGFDRHGRLAQASGDDLTVDVLRHLHAKHGRHIEDLLSMHVDGLEDSR